MSQTRGQDGFTLVELLIAMSLMLIVLSATFGVLESYQRNQVADQSRSEQQDAARNALDRMTSELRNATSVCGTGTGVTCTPSTAGALQRTTSYDVIFQTVEPVTVFGSSNPSNQQWVRYCLDASNPSSETLWKDVLTWTTASPPSMPSTTACPGTGVGAGLWPAAPASYQLLTNVTNENSGQNRPLFNYYTPTGAATPKSMEVDLFLDLHPTQAHPPETELRGGVDLRNSLGTPSSSFTISHTGGDAVLDASSSGDPNGQALTYAWYLVAGSSISCPPGGSAAATTPWYNAGALSGTYSFALIVTDSAGLNSCSTQTGTF